MSASQTETEAFNPQDVLTRPASSNIAKQVIDFSTSPLPMYTGSYAVILDNVLTPRECDDLLAAAEAHGNGAWERAMINVGGGRQALYTDVRNCGRIIWDDREVVGRLWGRLEPHMQEILRLENRMDVAGFAGKGCTWRMTRLNERMRFLKYVGGEYFKTHCGMYAKLINHLSLLSGRIRWRIEHQCNPLLPSSGSRDQSQTRPSSCNLT